MILHNIKDLTNPKVDEERVQIDVIRTGAEAPGGSESENGVDSGDRSGSPRWIRVRNRCRFGQEWKPKVGIRVRKRVRFGQERNPKVDQSPKTGSIGQEWKPKVDQSPKWISIRTRVEAQGGSESESEFDSDKSGSPR